VDVLMPVAISQLVPFFTFFSHIASRVFQGVHATFGGR